MPKALTVRQPFATRIVRGEKRVENRTRFTHIRGRILIHSGQKIHELYHDWMDPEDSRFPMSAIVGTAQLVDSHNAEVCPDREWCLSRGGFALGADLPLFHWVFEDAREFVTPIPRIKGKLGFWDPEPSALYLAEIADVVERQQS
jgi:hypothetical protein